MQSEAEEKEKMKKKATSDILAGLENNKVKVIHPRTICPRILDPFYIGSKLLHEMYIVVLIRLLIGVVIKERVHHYKNLDTRCTPTSILRMWYKIFGSPSKNYILV